MLRYIVNRQYDPVKFNNNVCFPLAKGSEWLLQRMKVLQVMEVHRGCVNTVVWDEPGNLLLSGSDDHHLVICDPWERVTKARIHTAHQANIFSAKFMPQTSNRKIMSCSGDGILVYTDVEKQEETHNCKFTCHISTCYDVITLPDDPHTFMTCGEDGTVRWFDLRVKRQCAARNCQEDILLNMGRAVTAVAVNPVTPYHLAVATQDSTIRIYDRRALGTRATGCYIEAADRALIMKLKPDSLEGKNHRVTSLRYSPDAKEVLASFSSDYLYLFDTQNFKEVTLEGVNETDTETNSGPILKRLRLRGDWSDTGPQALPESEMRNQAGDIGQARPTLHATIMQRMTDVLSRMLNDPGNRANVPPTSGSEASQPPSEADNPREDDNEASGMSDEASSPGPHQPVEVPAVTMQTPEQADNTDIPGTSSTDAVPRVESLVPGPRDECEDQGTTHEPDSTQANVPQTEGRHDAEPLGSAAELEGGGDDDDQPMDDSQRATISGLKNRISSLRQGFVEKHQVEPSLRLSYSGQGVSSGMISLAVGNEVTRGAEETQDAADTHQARDAQPAQTSDESQGPVATVSSSSSNESAASSSQLPQRPHAITTSSSSPAICDMDVASSSQAGDEEGGDDLVGGASASSSLRARASENLGHTVDFGDDDSDDDSASASARSARMATALERAVQRVKGERVAGTTTEEEVKVPQACVSQCYKGHRNARTMIKEACFWGDSHVMSGSDCGRVFVWERKSGRLVMLWEADRHVVNCLQPHPTLPVLATSGIDYDVKLWAPLSEESRFDEAQALEITRRNEALLEETRDTITVPATFMIRMLASLNQIRRGTGQVVFFSN